MFHGYILYKIDIFPQSLHYKLNFPTLPEKLNAGSVELFAEASELFTHAVFQLVVVLKMASSEYILQGAQKKMEVGGCKIGTEGRMREGKFKVHVYGGKVMTSVFWGQ